MTDEVENLAKAMYEAQPEHLNLRPIPWDLLDVVSRKWIERYAQVALAHIGERRGISFEGMSDLELQTLANSLHLIGYYEQAKACVAEMKHRDAELARRAAKPAEKDEWRGAIRAAVRKRYPIVDDESVDATTDRILAAIAPLREKLEREKKPTYCHSSTMFWKQRACEAEAKLAAIKKDLE